MDIRTVCAKGTKNQNRRRIGRGVGSGSGKTAGRGHKGWGARSGSSRRPGYEGGQMPMTRRIPKRGMGGSTGPAAEVISLGELAGIGGDVTVESLTAAGLVRRGRPVKILANGEIKSAVTVKGVMVSAGAREKIVRMQSNAPT